MEISSKFIENLKGYAKRTDSKELGSGSTVDEIIKAMVSAGEQGLILSYELNGKEIYSFMTEEQMYLTAFGKTKAKYEKELKRKKGDGPSTPSDSGSHHDATVDVFTAIMGG